MIFQLDGLRFACFGGRRTEKCLFMPLKAMCEPRVCNSQGAIALKTSVHVNEKDRVFMFPHVWMYFIQNEWRAQHARLLLQPLHFYPNSASTLLPWALTSQPLTHTDVHIAHAIVLAEIYTHQPRSGPAGPVLICILICMFWHGSTLQSLDCKGFRIISGSLLRTFPHMCRRRASVFAIMHRLSALHSTCIRGLIFRLCVCVYTDLALVVYLCVYVCGSPRFWSAAVAVMFWMGEQTAF